VRGAYNRLCTSPRTSVATPRWDTPRGWAKSPRRACVQTTDCYAPLTGLKGVCVSADSTYEMRRFAYLLAAAAIAQGVASHGQFRRDIGSDCDPSYPDVCIAPPPPDLDCPDTPFANFRVIGSDPHHFDADHDGIGCEPYRPR